MEMKEFESSNEYTWSIYQLLVNRYSNILTEDIIKEFYWLLKKSIFIATELKENILIDKYWSEQIMQIIKTLKKEQTEIKEIRENAISSFSNQLDGLQEESHRKWQSLEKKLHNKNIIIDKEIIIYSSTINNIIL